MKLLLDTSFILELKRGNKLAQEALVRERDRASEILVSLLSLYELYIGATYIWLKKGNTQELIWLEEFVKWVSLCYPNKQAVEIASKIQAEAMLKGRKFPDIDLLIAVSAGTNTILLTADNDHLEMQEYLKKYGVEVRYIEKSGNV
mgnify:CR=1 FL=1